MKLTDFVVPDAIVVDLNATDRDDAIAELLQSLTTAGAVEEPLRGNLMVNVLERENKGSTGFGKGVAVPHVKDDSIPRLAVAVGISQRGVEFKAIDGNPVYIIILLLSPRDRPDEHLQAMESIFFNLQKDAFRTFLRQARTREAVMALFEEADSQQIPN